MQNYEYYNRTRLIFGRDTHLKIGGLVKPYADKVLLVCGGGSIKKSGLYDAVTASLTEAGVAYAEVSGVRPNPVLDPVYEGIRVCREREITFVLGVGGGSVMDTAKAIAAGVPYDGDVWDLFTGTALGEVLPTAMILTLPATGSESSVNAVITKEETKEKKGIAGELLRPVFSILNPELCMTLPKEQMANAAFDMLSHVMERYFTNTIHTDVIDGLAESLMRNIMKAALRLNEDMRDYDAWCEFVEAGNLAHNGIMDLGRQGDWASHNMEHELSAFYDCAHGAGLAVVTPAWMKYVYQKHIPMFVQFAVNVMGIEGSFREPEKLAYAGIRALEEFAVKIGLPVRMEELGIDETKFEEMAKMCTAGGTRTTGNLEKLTWEDVMAVYRLAMQGQ